jgi:Zn-dependent peptidase ImmA (M78 family)
MSQEENNNQRSILARLRALVPGRPLAYAEALRLSELQANRFRELLGVETPELPDAAITELPRILVVSEMDLPVSGSAHWSNGRWIIAVNALEHPLRQRFSAAHELHHIIVHPLRPFLLVSEQGLPSSVKAERLADYFAANLLMPKRHVKRLWGEGARDAATLAEHFQVSPRAMEVRLSQLGLVEGRQRCWPDVRDGRHYNRPLPVTRSLGLAA